MEYPNWPSESFDPIIKNWDYALRTISKSDMQQVFKDAAVEAVNKKLTDLFKLVEEGKEVPEMECYIPSIGPI